MIQLWREGFYPEVVSARAEQENDGRRVSGASLVGQRRVQVTEILSFSQMLTFCLQSVGGKAEVVEIHQHY